MGFDWLSNAYGRVIYGLTDQLAIGLIAMMLVYAGVIAATLHLVQNTPTGFIPDQDQGYLIGVVQLPSGRLAGTHHRRGEPGGRRARKIDGVTNTVIIAGFDGANLHQHHQFGRDVHHAGRRQGAGGQGCGVRP